jgi:damage-control phosphatase, subfamily I
MIRQALNTARIVTDDPAIHLKVVRRVAKLVPGLSLHQTPAGLSQPAYDVVAKVTGVKDPYKRERKKSNRLAMRLVPALKVLIGKASDPLDAALHVAVAGNVIDLGIGHKFNIERDVRNIMKQKFAVSSAKDFRRELKRGRKILYLGDNAGEIVFDKLLIEQILPTGAEIVFAVKSAPIINDAVMQDARETGMTNLVKVITTGSNDIGINWHKTSREFKRAFTTADVILCKGHGNFETLHDRTENLYFLLKVKCDMVADEIGVKLGDIVFARGSRRR